MIVVVLICLVPLYFLTDSLTAIYLQATELNIVTLIWCPRVDFNLTFLHIPKMQEQAYEAYNDQHDV